MNSGKFEEALDLFLDILEEKSSKGLSKEFLMNIAFCLKELGDQENSEVFIEKANSL